MKRWTLRILLCLILGVVMTVGVAWGFGAFIAWSDADSYYDYGIGDDSSRRAFIIGDSPDRAGTRMAYCAEGLGWSTAKVIDMSLSTEEMSRNHPDAVSESGFFCFAPPEHETEHPHWEYSCYAFGWPMRSMRALVLVNSRIEARVWRSEGESMIVTETDQSQRGPVTLIRPIRFLPLRPIFPGFLVNTLFYAAIWFGIFFGVATLRRFVRRKRGRCVKCGYDLRGQRAGGHSASGNRHSGGDTDRSATQMPNAESPMPSSTGCPECGWGREDAFGLSTSD